MLQIQEFNLNLFLLLTKNKRSDSIYCDGKDRIFKCFGQIPVCEPLFLNPVLNLQ